MLMTLKNKSVLITGSSIGIGRETAYMFAKEGCRVVITYYKDEKEARLVEEKCRELGAPDAIVLKLNVTEDKSIKDCVKAVVKKFKQIDILVNNAGIIVWKSFNEQTYQDIENQTRTNLEGLMKMTSEALPHVRDTIINVASGAGKTGYAGIATYCATKFGVRGFSQSLAKETKLKIYVINPGVTATRMNDFRGLPPERVAEVIVNAAKGKYKVPSGGDVDVWEVLK